jgi:EmrB/QacA subfamily drug resistance transporter
MFKKHLAFIGLLMGSFVAFVDYMIVNNALPSIQETFHVPLISLQWVTTIYSIILASTLILFGRIGDIFGTKRIFYTGAWLLGLGSLAAGFSPSYNWLIFFRAIQSFGVSALIVAAPGILQSLYKEKSQKPMGIYASVGGLGLMIGPTMGGFIIKHWRWEGVFWINVPILLISLIICWIALPHNKESLHLEKNAFYKLDLVGNLLIFINLTALIFLLIEIEQVGLGDKTIISFVIFLISLLSLIVIEKNHTFPTLDLSHFKNRDFRFAVLNNISAGTLVTCGMFFSPIFLQTIMHFSPSTTGVILLAFAAIILVASPIFGALSASIKPWQIILLALFFGVFSSIGYIIFFEKQSLLVGMIAFALTGFVLAINNTFSALSAIDGLGEDKAGTSVGTIFAIFSIIGALTLGITSLLLHKFNIGMHIPQTHAYSMSFVFVLLITVLVAIIGWVSRKS